MFSVLPYTDGFFGDLNTEFFGRTRGFKTDIREEDDKYILECEIPGFSKDEIKVEAVGGSLSLSAEKNSERENKSGKYLRRERTECSYNRVFDIPNVDADSIDANYSDGILTLTLPKKQAQIPESRRIQIK